MNLSNDNRQKIEVSLRHHVSAFSRWCVLLLLPVLAVVGMATLHVRMNDEVKDLKNKKQKLSSEISRLEKTTQYYLADLDQQKTAPVIIQKARALGLRPADSSQNVYKLRVVKGRGSRDERALVRLEKTDSYLSGYDSQIIVYSQGGKEESARDSRVQYRKHENYPVN